MLGVCTGLFWYTSRKLNGQSSIRTMRTLGRAAAGADAGAVADDDDAPATARTMATARTRSVAPNCGDLFIAGKNVRGERPARQDRSSPIQPRTEIPPRVRAACRCRARR